MLVLLSIVLKTRPSVLLLLVSHFLENATRYNTSGRLPFQLWVVNQAARYSLPTPLVEEHSIQIIEQSWFYCFKILKDKKGLPKLTSPELLTHCLHGLKNPFTFRICKTRGSSM